MITFKPPTPRDSNMQPSWKATGLEQVALAQNYLGAPFWLHQGSRAGHHTPAHAFPHASPTFQLPIPLLMVGTLGRGDTQLRVKVGRYQSTASRRDKARAEET